jgi:hypothetical protein
MDSGRPELVPVFVDNSGINQVLDQLESKPKQHDEQLEKLLRLVNTLPTKSDIEKARSEMAAAVQKARLDADSKIKPWAWN